MNRNILEMKGIRKSYSSVRVLWDVDISVGEGEIVGLIGENGAGKSTLMKILSGGAQPDAGEIVLDGRTVQITNPIVASELKIAMVQQELSLIPSLTVQDNIVLGREFRTGVLKMLDFAGKSVKFKSPEEAIQAGLGLVTEDRKFSGIFPSMDIGSNNYDAGVIAAQFMSERLGSKSGEVAIIEGNPGDTCAVDRTSGFADKSGELSNLKLVASQTAKWDRLQALEVATGILRANPNVRGIYCNNDTMVLGAMQAAADLGYTILTSDNIEKAGENKTIMLIGNDGVPEALEAVRDGELTGTIAQKPYLMGYAAVEAAIIKLEGKTPDTKIATPIKLVVKSDYQ